MSPNTSSSNTSSGSPSPRARTVDYAPNHFTFRHGRRYLRDQSITYPLPVDLTELNRQSLQTLLLINVFGAPFCSNFFEKRPPKKVLEIACGAAFWSSACHDHFKRQGYPDVSFTGLDIAPLAPDLRKNGVNWRFVRHDLRKSPLPFEDEEFDFIFVKDTTFCLVNPQTELMRFLKPGGVIEVWESNLHFRCILPYSSIIPNTAEEDIDQAEETATYIVTSGTAFAPAQNRYIQDLNLWAKKGLVKLSLTTTPCAVMGVTFSTVSDVYRDVGTQKVAVPFGEVRWEREGIGGEFVQKKKRFNSRKSISKRPSATRESRVSHRTLTSDQAALRRIALTTVIELGKSLEPILREESGMKQDEWDPWWAGMNTDLLEDEGTLNGECLEVGAWWVRKT